MGGEGGAYDGAAAVGHDCCAGSRSPLVQECGGEDRESHHDNPLWGRIHHVGPRCRRGGTQSRRALHAEVLLHVCLPPAQPRTFDARCSRRGELLGFWSGEELQEEAGAETEEDEPDAYHRPMSNPEMARHVRRFRDGQSLSVQAKGSFVNVSSRDKRPQHRVQLRTDPASSRALAGLLACTGSRRDAGDSLQSPRGRCAPGGARGFPLADASGWRARGRHIAARLGARVCGRGTRHPGVQPASHAVHDTRRRVADAGDRRPPVRRMDRCRRFPDVDDGCAAVAPSPSSLVIWSRIEAPRSGSMGGECFAPVEEAWRAIGARGGRKERRIASATFTCRSYPKMAAGAHVSLYCLL